LESIRPWISQILLNLETGGDTMQTIRSSEDVVLGTDTATILSGHNSAYPLELCLACYED